MANPAPTINQINAFNATQGTTIDFNIIGGTELVRSNRIYIYDLSDNSLICTHLYVSTESIHELPPNTDGSIVYESGKSSADFVNGAQYYAQIQTFTDIGGTEGGSGLSVAKMFWCLVDPSLTISTIPSTISTTSYNVSATYDANTSVVSNIIQQYQFNLYSATGSLLQSSGVIVGNGEQQGTSTAYDISYNFTGLSVGSSYYVMVDVTTTQGMNVSAQSGTFTVSIDTPTLGEATVVNNACDGYISVTSNLSSEYGGSASGEIASFVTNSVNNVSSLKVNLEPIQDLHGYDKPWVGGAGANKWDEEYETGGIDGDTGENTSSTTTSRSLNYCPILPNTTYYAKTDSNGIRVYWYDSNKTYLGSQYRSNNTFTTPNNTAFFRIVFTGTTYNHDIAINYPSSVTTYSPYENICPITGWTGCEVDVRGKNLVSASFSEYVPLYLPKDTVLIASAKSTGVPQINYYDANQTRIDYWSCQYDVVDGRRASRAFTLLDDAYYFRFTGTSSTEYQLEFGDTATAYEPYNGQTYSVSWQDEAGAVYGGTLDLVSGVLTVTHEIVAINNLNVNTTSTPYMYRMYVSAKANGVDNFISSAFHQSADPNHMVNGETNGVSTSPNIYVVATDCATTEAFKTTYGTQTFCYELATPTTYQLTSQQIETLVGQNNVWSEQGDVEVIYNIPITNLLVKRQDVDDVSGDWLTLHSQPVSQASDMDFTFIDFTNQYGKTYKYALVPLLTQTQSGVEVEVEGGYTVSDEVQSVFDGVFIADRTGLQKCKANVGYGNVDMNQVVGSITPIGAKYPIIITNSQNQYHNGSISGTIVPDDYYFNGNLSRIDMVNKRNELEQFLTNKRAKIIKDWNGNIWLVMIMDNVSCTFNNSYGMGIVNFSTNWVEVGDPTNQQDLQATGLINVGGV